MDDLQELFKKIEDNIFETQNTKQKSSENDDPNMPSTKQETNISKKDLIKTEAKESRVSKLRLEYPKEQIEEESKEKEQALVPGDEYSDYGRIDKNGIHFQIISDLNVSIEIVPKESLTDEVKQLILKYKGVYDDSMQLWLVPYVNYEALYNELFMVESLRNKIHKVGSIAQEYYSNKNLQKLIIRRKKQDEILDYTTDTKERNPDELPEKIRKSLYNFQSEGIKFGINHHCRFLLADEMGVGKTLQAISLAYIYRDSWPVLVVCPGSMKYNWKAEIQTWLGLKDYRICILNRSKQKISQEAYFYIISYDLMRNVIKKLRQIMFDFVILDEAHSIKNKDSLRAKNILPIAVRAKRLIIMTGTPLLAKPYEGYPLLYALRPDIFCYFKKFAYRYCDPQPTPNGINWSGTSNTKELHWILSCLMVRRLKRDVLNQLPPKRRQKIWIKTDEKIVEQLKKTKTNIKGRKGTLECYTLTCKAKIKGVISYISDIIDAKEKFIVFAYHHEMLDSLEELCKNKKIEYMRIDGTTKQDVRYQYVNYFQKNPECQVAILSIIAASTGITLTATHMVIFAELTWTPSIMIQAEDRVHRIGQKSEFVDIKYLYGEETLDDFVLDKLQKKLTIVSTTLDDKKEILGVKANPDKIDYLDSKKSDLWKYNKGELCEEYDFGDAEELEKKMFDDLGETSGKKENKNKDKNKGNKKKKNKKNKKTNKKVKTANIKKDDDDESNDSNDEDIKYPKKKDKNDVTNDDNKINLGQIFNFNSNTKDTKNKPINYPKENSGNKNKNKSKDRSKRTPSYSDVKTVKGSKISGIKDLKKYWATSNKGKSVNKISKIKVMINHDKLPENTSKKTVLTLADDSIIMKDENTSKININNLIDVEAGDKDKIQIECKDEEKGKENELNAFFKEIDKNINEDNNTNNIEKNINEIKKEEYIQYENDLLTNLHKSDMRRNMSQGSNKKTQKELMELNEEPNQEYRSYKKRILYPSKNNPFKENTDENIIHNLEDKVSLIDPYI